MRDQGGDGRPACEDQCNRRTACNFYSYGRVESKPRSAYACVMYTACAFEPGRTDPAAQIYEKKGEQSLAQIRVRLGAIDREFLNIQMQGLGKLGHFDFGGLLGLDRADPALSEETEACRAAGGARPQPWWAKRGGRSARSDRGRDAANEASMQLI